MKGPDGIPATAQLLAAYLLVERALRYRFRVISRPTAGGTQKTSHFVISIRTVVPHSYGYPGSEQDGKKEETHDGNNAQ